MRTPASLLVLLAACTGAPQTPEPDGVHDFGPPPEPRVTTIGSPERRLAEWVDSRRDAMLRLLSRLVEQNSRSLDAEAVGRVLDFMESELRGLGFECRRIPGRSENVHRWPKARTLGDHLVARREGGGPCRVLLLGHVDTGLRSGHSFPGMSIKNRLAGGPGVAGKGGLVILLFALKALASQGHLRGPVTALLSSDREIGSPSSRRILRREAGRHDVGLAFEPTVGNAVVRRRSGWAEVRISVRGLARDTPSGGGPEASGIRELARKIEKLTDKGSGLTVNVRVEGGKEGNGNPCTEALVDLHYPTEDIGRYAIARIRRIVDQVDSTGSPAVRAEMEYLLERPPKPPAREVDRLLAIVRGIGLALGREMPVVDSDVGTDGNLTQAAGLPTLDSLGPVVRRTPSGQDEIDLDLFVWRAKLAAILLYRLTRGKK